MINITPITQEEIDEQMEEMLKLYLWDEGNYQFDTISVMERISKSSGQPMIVLSLSFIKDNGDRNSVWVYLVCPPRPPKENDVSYNKYVFSMSKVKSYFESVGLLDYYMNSTSIDCLHILNNAKRGMALLKIQKAEGQYPAKNIVGSFLKPVVEDKTMNDDIPF